MEYIIWCDESISKGEHFSNFYGGAIAESRHAAEVIRALKAKKQELNLFGEVKWVKVSVSYLEKYKELMSLFFSFVNERKVKIRIMFRDNRFHPRCLSRDQIRNGYYYLYYQFIKGAFGLQSIYFYPETVSIRINFDKLPDKKDQNKIFKNYIFGINKLLNGNGMYLNIDNISEVESHKHVILQCLDVVLGSMGFKLNKNCRVDSKMTREQGGKTKAKEELYCHIKSEIDSLYPSFSFNVEKNTGKHEGPLSFWSMPYRHWSFIPTQCEFIDNRGDK